MHPLEAALDSSFHNPTQQKKRRSSLDNSALSAQESFMSCLIPDIEDYGGSSSRKRRYSLNSCEYKNTTFLAELMPTRNKKEVDLDLDFHTSGHSEGPVTGRGGGTRRHSRDSNKLQDGTGDTQNTSLGDTIDLSESSMEESSSGTFCDAEEGEPANRAYLQKDLGASCFWDDDFESDSDEENEKPAKTLPTSSNERNQRIQAALERVRKAKEKGTETSTTIPEETN